jgi:predicted Zn-dependent peptidase
VVGGAGLSRGHDLRWAMAVLNQAVGGGMASRLFQEVREKRGLAYSVYSYPSAYADSGTFGVYAGTAPAKAAEVVEVVRAELDAVLRGGLTADEVAMAKGYLTGSTIMALEDTNSRMSRIGRALTTAQPLLDLDELMAEIESVTPDDVRAVAELVLGGPTTVAAVGPIDADDLAGVV